MITKQILKPHMLMKSWFIWVNDDKMIPDLSPLSVTDLFPFRGPFGGRDDVLDLFEAKI